MVKVSEKIKIFLINIFLIFLIFLVFEIFSIFLKINLNVLIF